MSLFIAPPTIDPRDYLAPHDVAKIAGVKLMSPPSHWDDEVRQALLRDCPYIPADRIVVNFSQKDEATGSALGFAGITGSPHVSIPVIIRNRELSPLDVLIIRSRSAEQQTDTQGAGDLNDDIVCPLNQDSFESAMDAGTIGEPVDESTNAGFAYTEDASALRLPFRGRTVIASVVGASQAQKDAFAQTLSDKTVLAGFVTSQVGEVVDAWLAAPSPAKTITTKIASVQAVKTAAKVLSASSRDVVELADIGIADVYLEDGTVKSACVANTIDLAKPDVGLAEYVIYEDGTYAAGSSKIASRRTDKTFDGILDALTAPALKVGGTVMFKIENVLTTPAKLAAVTTDATNASITLKMSNDTGHIYNVMLDKRIKQATFSDATATWILPISTEVLALSDYAKVAAYTPEALATVIDKTLTDSITCANGQWSLNVNGSSVSHGVSEEKMASLLSTVLTNADDLMLDVKTAAASARGTATVRFASDYGLVVGDQQKIAALADEGQCLSKDFVDDLRMPMHLAVKLAAVIGDPQGVDAVLGTGFLSEDNLAEFVGLADDFSETVNQLSRLLLAIRLGFPGDETATVVAMKSLARVATRLQSAGQEI